MVWFDCDPFEEMQRMQEEMNGIMRGAYGKIPLLSCGERAAPRPIAVEG